MLMKKALVSGIVFSLFMLVGCNTTEVVESEQEVEVSRGSMEGDGLSNLISELEDKIIGSIKEQTELKSDSLTIMVDGGTEELTVSVGFPKDAKTDNTQIQQLIEDSIKNVSETKTGATSEEKINIKIKTKIEKY